MLKKLGAAAVLLLFLSLPADAQWWVRQGGNNQEWVAGNAGIGATLTEVKAIPAAGGQHHITTIIDQSTTATVNSWSIESGTGTNCATTTTAVLPSDNVSTQFNGVTNAQSAQVIQLSTPLHILPGHAICVKGIATQLTKIAIVGYTTP